MTSLDLSSGPFLRLPSEARGQGSWRITEDSRQGRVEWGRGDRGKEGVGAPQPLKNPL